MKKIVLSSLLCGVVLAGGLISSCSLADGEGDSLYGNGKTPNAVYMKNATPTGVVSTLIKEGQGGFVDVTPQLAAPAEKDVSVTIAADAEVVNKYAERNGLKFKGLTKEDVLFIDTNGKEHAGEITVTIPKGSVQTSVSCGVRALDDDKYPFSTKWAIGAVITKSDAGVTLLSQPKSTIITLNRQFKTSVMHWIHSDELVVQMNEPVQQDVTDWTFQMQVHFSRLGRNDCFVASPNQTVANLFGFSGSEWYTRISEEGGLQLKMGRDGGDTWTNKPLRAKKWMQITYTFHRTGTNRGVVSAYVNGELQKTWISDDYSWAKGTKEAGWRFGGCPWGDDYVREIKMWNKVLSLIEMQEKLYLPEDPKDPNLIFYVPLNRETMNPDTNEIKELTGNAHVITKANTSFEIVDNVIFPNDDLVILSEE